MLYLLCSKRCKDITKKLHSCSNERSVLRIVSNFPYFSGISLHDRPCFVTQLAQLMTTHARKFFSVAGDWQKIFKTC